MFKSLLLASVLLVGTVEAQTGGFSAWGFLCGKTMLTCGPMHLVGKDSQCKMTTTVTSTVKLSAKQCTAMKEQAPFINNGDLFTSTAYCPDKTKIKSFFKYRPEPDGTWTGRKCTPGKGVCECCYAANGFGDPHFTQYDGKPYSYHGKCDMVMAHSESFGNGVGLRVHGRTEIVDDWSRIRNAAVQIGNDTVELSNKGIVYLNGKPVDADMVNGASLSGVYNISQAVKVLGNIPKTEIVVHLNEEHDQKIKLSLYKNIINVHVGAEEQDLQGMLGHKIVDGFVGRDKLILDTHHSMGEQWQVRDTEPMLFNEIVAPQYPEQCIMPSVDGRRKLRKSQHIQRRAEEACAGIENKVMRNFCMEDVTLSGDVDLAHVYHAGLH
jgi:von Willebrand factor type D domain